MARLIGTQASPRSISARAGFLRLVEVESRDSEPVTLARGGVAVCRTGGDPNDRSVCWPRIRQPSRSGRPVGIGVDAVPTIS